MAFQAYIILTGIFLYTFDIIQALNTTNLSNPLSAYELSEENEPHPITSVFKCPKTQECSCEFSNIELHITVCNFNGTVNFSNLFHFYPNITHLEISYSHLSRFPCEVLSLAQLTTLNLSGNRIHSVPCDLTNLSHLRVIDLSSNSIREFPCKLLSLTQLVSLDLSHNVIQSVRCNFSAMSSLTTLDLYTNHLKLFPCEITSLTSIVYLNLSFNHIDSVPCNLSTLTNLTFLDLSYQRTDTFQNFIFPCALATLPKLKELDLSGNQINSVACDLSAMDKLNSLDLSGDSFKSFPCNLTTISSLLSLDLSSNHLKSMFCDFSNFTKLIHLDISSNGIEQLCDTTGRCTFPFEFSTLTHLTSLDLSHNSLQSVPCDISYLVNLTFLGLSWNNLKYMHCDLSNLTQLTTLDLHNNEFDSMPCELSTLTELTSLNLRLNPIKSVPCDLSNLSHLTYLDISQNDLIAFACELTTLPKLKTLKLQRSRIWSVPCDLSNLSHLTHLDISRNKLTAFPCELTTLSNLKTLHLSWNYMGSITCDMSNMTDIKSIELSGNIFYTFPCALTNLSKLSSLDVSFNRIMSIPCDLSNMTNLTSIKLSNNRISILDSWPIMLAGASLQKLNLDFNQLTQFTNYAGTSGVLCTAIHHPFSMSLKNNKITHIMDIVKGWNLNMKTKEELYNCLDFIVPQIEWNLLTCDCVDYDVYWYLQNKRISWRNRTRCYYPPKLRGLKPAYISLDQFVCHISENCPPGCTCTNSPFYQNISVNCEYTEFITLPDNIPELPNEDYGYSLQFINGNLRNISYTPYLRNVKAAKFGNNLITEISMEALVALQNVSLLHLDHNALQRLPGNITDIHFKGGIGLKLGGNPWICNCTTMDIRSWMKDHEAAITDKFLVTCHSPPHMLNKTMLYTDDNIFCPKNNVQISNYLIGLVVLGTSIPIICIFSLIAMRIRRLKVNGRLAEQMALLDEVDADREFDVFVSYACEEEDYILDDFIPQLENHNFKVCCHRIHFLAGNTIVDNISECINHSKRTLVYFTNFYKNSRFCMWEFKEVLNKDIRDGTIRLITVKDTDLDITDLDDSTSAYFEKRTYLEFNAPRFWENLIHTLPRRVANLEEFEMQ